MRPRSSSSRTPTSGSMDRKANFDAFGGFFCTLWINRWRRLRTISSVSAHQRADTRWAKFLSSPWRSHHVTPLWLLIPRAICLWPLRAVLTGTPGNMCADLNSSPSSVLFWVTSADPRHKKTACWTSSIIKPLLKNTCRECSQFLCHPRRSLHERPACFSIKTTTFTHRAATRLLTSVKQHHHPKLTRLRL